MRNDTIWVPPSTQKQPRKLNCPKCGRPATLIPIGKCEGQTVWAPFCQHCEKPWTAEQKRTIQKCIHNRKTIPKEEYERMNKNPGKGEFSMPESDPSSQAFIKSYISKHHRVFMEANDTKRDAGSPTGDQPSRAKRPRAKKAGRATAKAH